MRKILDMSQQCRHINAKSSFSVPFSANVLAHTTTTYTTTLTTTTA